MSEVGIKRLQVSGLGILDYYHQTFVPVPKMEVRNTYISCKGKPTPKIALYVRYWKTHGLKMYFLWGKFQSHVSELRGVLIIEPPLKIKLSEGH